VPRRVTGRCRASETTVAAATAAREKGTVGFQRAPASISTAEPRARSRAAQCGVASNSSAALAATTATWSPRGVGTPSADGTCCSAITHAMPMVKPAITGAGTYAIAAPARANARTSSITPAIRPTVRTPFAP